MSSTIDPSEIEFFSKMAEEWWNPEGKFKPIHKWNPSRIEYIKEKIIDHYGLNASPSKQFENLMALIYEYAKVLSPDIAQGRINSADKTPRDRLFFAWAGSVQPGLGDYYRVQSPKFLIEYDNTQNKNNHSHCVWRDFSGDFGRDLLAQHYR